MSIEQDRRRSQDRRQINAGPPPGCGERRHTMDRRILALEVFSLETWMAGPRIKSRPYRQES